MSKTKVTALLIAVALIITSGLSGCSKPSQSTSNNQPASNTQPENKDVRMLTGVTGGKDDEEMKLFVEQLSKETGLNITMDKPASDYNNVLMQKLQAGEKYDLVYLNQDQLPYLAEQGAIKDITKEVADSKVLSDTNVIPQSEWDSIKVNGKIYAGFNKREVHRVVNVNSVIASKAGVDVANIDPTLEGYYQLFKKMKDYNDNTAKVSGFYPLNIALVSMFDLQPWFSSVGLKGGIVLDSNNKKTVPWSSDAAAPVWEWLHKLYAEGLLDKDSLTDATKQLRNKFQTGQTGVVVDWAAWTGLYNANAGNAYPNDFKAYPLPGTKSPNGNYMLTRGAASLWAIPANAQNVSGAIKVLEYFASQQGGELLSVGIKGYDYNIEGDKYVLTDIGAKHACDHGAPVPVNVQFKNPIGWNPGFEDAMQYLKYASIENALPQTSKYTEIVSKYGVKIIKGDLGVQDGLNAMRNELKQAGVID